MEIIEEAEVIDILGNGKYLVLPRGESVTQEIWTERGKAEIEILDRVAVKQLGSSSFPDPWEFVTELSGKSVYLDKDGTPHDLEDEVEVAKIKKDKEDILIIRVRNPMKDSEKADVINQVQRLWQGPMMLLHPDVDLAVLNKSGFSPLTFPSHTV